MKLIRVSGLTKTFDGVPAVRGVDFTVAPGEIVGFLGRNGAGKTTTMRMLTTLLPPTSGTAVIAGRDLLADPDGVRRTIGYVAQGGATDPTRPVGEELEFQAMLYGMRAAEARRRAAVVLAALGLAGLEDRPVGALSGGQRRRLDIALGLVHGPRLLFLDEPTTGLDPQSRAELWTCIRALRDERDVTVFLTTHYLEEADALCDRLLIIDDGRIVADGTPGELRRRAAGPAAPTPTLEEAFLALTGRPIGEGR
ncbi:ABC transporter ATP-binding protein [Thermostaphylospora chromogena]|uniref:ABC transporter ATP-binding protein n=1 Tax=Thermostaphylospora chromogena TaxID=35622 RepID=UPI000B866B7B|nr:ATP-binding cassette domain-containing protein [Thermostaphylospora chromogena]